MTPNFRRVSLEHALDALCLTKSQLVGNLHHSLTKSGRVDTSAVTISRSRSPLLRGAFSQGRVPLLPPQYPAALPRSLLQSLLRSLRGDASELEFQRRTMIKTGCTWELLNVSETIQDQRFIFRNHLRPFFSNWQRLDGLSFERLSLFVSAPSTRTIRFSKAEEKLMEKRLVQ